MVEDYTSYRHVSDRIGVSPTAILDWVNAYGENAKSPIEIAKELKPHWSGILGVDGKPVKIASGDAVVLIAVDMGTYDPFFFNLVDAEDEENAQKFFLIIKEVFKFPVEALVSDFGKGRVFVHLAEHLFPNTPHQTCVLHFSRYVDMKLPKSPKSKYHWQNEYLRGYINNLLFAECYNDAEEMLIRLRNIEHLFKAKYQQEIIHSLRRNFELLTAHFFHDNLPRDTNIVENIVKQLNRKLIQMHGFKSRQNAYNFLKLWFCAYRFRPFSASQIPHRSGRSPLNLAGVKTDKVDWLRYSQRSN